MRAAGTTVVEPRRRRPSQAGVSRLGSKLQCVDSFVSPIDAASDDSKGGLPRKFISIFTLTIALDQFGLWLWTRSMIGRPSVCMAVGTAIWTAVSTAVSTAVASAVATAVWMVTRAVSAQSLDPALPPPYPLGWPWRLPHKPPRCLSGGSAALLIKAFARTGLFSLFDIRCLVEKCCGFCDCLFSVFRFQKIMLRFRVLISLSDNVLFV